MDSSTTCATIHDNEALPPPPALADLVNAPPGIDASSSTTTTTDNTPSAVRIANEEQASHEQEKQVHSLESLRESRAYCEQLLDDLPKVNKTLQAEKCLEMERKLQKSIRLRSYADIEFIADMRKFLTKGFTIGTLIASGVVVTFGLGAMMLGKPLDDAIFSKLMNFVYTAIGANAVTIVAFYFKAAKAIK